VIASLAAGQEATVVGRNADNSWWVLEYPSAAATCWVWGEIVELSTDTCEVSVVDAPPLPPTETPTPTVTPTFTPTTPAADTTPPPAPKQLKPTNGSELSAGSAMLRWETVSDESSIAEYQVELQRSPDESSWEHVSGSPFTGVNDTNLEVSVDVSYYRWRVRAVDGAGNTGEWSGWFSFVVPLT
jgi:hypothetical protein